MSHKIEKYLPELVQAGIISGEKAQEIAGFYNERPANDHNKLLIVFGILGAILSGLGVILIIAHNWDELARPVKTAFAFLPLIIGQVLCAYSLLKKNDSAAWREASSAFLLLSVGASISLVSQIYHIPGNVSSFLLTWMLLCLPLVYIMRSSATSLLTIIGITYYAAETGYFASYTQTPYFYWLMLAALIPHYYLLLKNSPQGNFTAFHNWLLPLSVIICLGTVFSEDPASILLSYMGLFGLFYLFGKQLSLAVKTGGNGYLVLGATGIISLLLFSSFQFFWDNLSTEPIGSDFMVAVALTLAASVLLFIRNREKLNFLNDPMEIMYLLFFFTFFSMYLSPILAMVLINLMVLLYGITLVFYGSKWNKLGMLNLGLLTITALIACRFFDINISFILRGIIFIGLGAGFFLGNYRLLKTRRVK